MRVLAVLLLALVLMPTFSETREVAFQGKPNGQTKEN
jgi:hypothetical protein